MTSEILKANNKCNRELNKRWAERGVDRCEIRLPGCLVNMWLQNVHRHKREYYRRQLYLLYEDTQVVRGCQTCHTKIEKNTKLTEEVFTRLRGKEVKRVEQKKIINRRIMVGI